MIEFNLVSDINCSMTEVKWTKLQLNRNVWVCVTLLGKKSCALINGYSFCPSDKRSIAKWTKSQSK